MKQQLLSMTHPHRQHFVIRNALLAALAASCLVGASLFVLGAAYDQHYQGQFYPGVIVLGLPMGGQTYAQANQLVESRAQSVLAQPITLSFPDGTTQLVTPRDLGMTLDTTQMLQEAYARGRRGSLLDRLSEQLLLRSSGAAYAFSPIIDRSTLEEHIQTELAQHERAAKNPTLRVDNDQFVVDAGESGLSLNKDALTQDLEWSLRTLNLPSEIAVPSVSLDPELSAEELASVQAEAKMMTNVLVAVQIANRTATIPQKTVVTWLTMTAEANSTRLSWNGDLVRDAVKKLGQKYDVAMQPHTINSRTGEDMAAGKAGQKMDQTATVAAIIDALEAHRSGLTDPTAQTVTVQAPTIAIAVVDKQVAPGFTPGQYDGKYIEVNLRQQKLYQFEGATLVATYPVSTGKWSTPTPIGVRYIINHIPYAYSKPHNLYMPWWLGLATTPEGAGYNGYGIHELPEWKGGRKEGENHLGRPVSHGCIRLGIGPAKAMYDWADNGTPVVIHA